MRGASISHISKAAIPFQLAKVFKLTHVLQLQQQQRKQLLRYQHVKFSAFIKLLAREQHLSRQTPVGLTDTRPLTHLPIEINRNLVVKNYLQVCGIFYGWLNFPKVRLPTFSLFLFLLFFGICSWV